VGVELKPETQAFVRELVAKGAYSSEQEAIEAALTIMRLDVEDAEAERQAIQEGLDSPFHAFDAQDTIRRGNHRWQARHRK